MQTRILIVVLSLLVASSHQVCSITDTHGLPSCPLNAALDAGNAAGLLQTCMYNICCWCNDTTFTSQLNETWKGCAAADRDAAYVFFQAECYSQATTNTTSSQANNASSNTATSSVANTTPVATSSSTSTPTLLTSSSSRSSSSTSTTTTSPAPASGASTGRKTFNTVTTIAFAMAIILWLEV